MGLTTISLGSKGSGSSQISSGVCRRDRASALTFFEPGR